MQMSFGKDYNQKSNSAVMNDLNQNPHKSSDQILIEKTVEKVDVLIPNAKSEVSPGEESSVVTNEVDKLLLSLEPLPENESRPLVQEELKLPNLDPFQEQGHELHEEIPLNDVSMDKEDPSNYIFY